MAASERTQPVSLARRSDSCCWLSGVFWWVFGSQLRLSKAETFLHFRLAEFQVPLDTESRSYNRPNFRRFVDCIVGVIHYISTKGITDEITDNHPDICSVDDVPR